MAPPGAGHEAVALSIHQQSSRSPHAFIRFECALSDTVPGIQEIGDSDGTLTDQYRVSRQGTLFLEHLDQLPQAAQLRLISLLQKTSGLDVRLLASTSKPIEELAQKGRFDRTLLELIGLRQLRIPALAERPQDIEVLVGHFVRIYCRRLGKVPLQISEEAVREFRNHTWPGNIRELEGALERMVLASQGPDLEISGLKRAGTHLGSYRLVKKLGQGAMGEVWSAQHELLTQPAAVKLIRSETLGDSTQRNEVIRRFQREAQLTSELNSPHTVRLFDFGIAEDGSFYYVMELLRGIDLESMVDRYGPLKPERSAYFIRQVCRSLGEAHAAGLIHRDIKPSNLQACRMGCEYDYLKVLDFGIARRLYGSQQMTLTATGIVTGTPAFIAPEVALGGKSVDQRADLYSVGCVAFWLLTGSLGFRAESAMEMMMAHVQSEPSAPSTLSELDVPPELDALILRCLAKDPQDRPADALQVSRELDSIRWPNAWNDQQAEAWWKRHLPEV